MSVRVYSNITVALSTLLLIAGLVGCTDPPVYTQAESRTDGGSGRFYMDREIADVMSSEHGALWLDRPKRNVEELPNRLLRALDLNASTVVADIGSGTGFFTFRFAEMVPSGRVYSVEVQEALVDTIRVRAERDGFRNVTPILGSFSDPSLPANRIDLALIVSSYHEFSFPREMIEAIARSLKEDGRLVIVEYRIEDDTTIIPEAHRMSVEQIRAEIESVGLQFRESIEVLPQQHIVVFSHSVDSSTL